MKRTREDGQGGSKRPAGCVDVFSSFSAVFSVPFLLCCCCCCRRERRRCSVSLSFCRASLCFARPRLDPATTVGQPNGISSRAPRGCWTRRGRSRPAMRPPFSSEEKREEGGGGGGSSAEGERERQMLLSLTSTKKNYDFSRRVIFRAVLVACLPPRTSGMPPST